MVSLCPSVAARQYLEAILTDKRIKTLLIALLQTEEDKFFEFDSFLGFLLRVRLL